MPDRKNPIVYSTETGRLTSAKSTSFVPTGDGIVRLQRQTSGRRGKGVTVITGILSTDTALAALAAEIKKRCGCGGSVKNGTIEIQGDKRDIIKTFLESKGYQVKLSGG